MIIGVCAAPGGVSTGHVPMINSRPAECAVTFVALRVSGRNCSVGVGAHAGHMARGDHPMRTPVYGAALIGAAMIGATLVVSYGEGLPGWLHGALLVIAIPIAFAGWLMTFRDLSPRRRRGRR
jgi:hypothetical protein